MDANPEPQMGQETQLFLAEIFNREYCQLKEIAYLESGRRAQVVDPSGAAVEALIRAAAKRDQFRGTTVEERFRWLRRILVNEVLDTLRLAECRRRSTDDNSPPDPSSSEPGPVAGAERIDDAAALYRAMSTLSDTDRDVLLLTYRQDVSQAACAVILGISDSAYRQRLSRASTRLRAEMERRT
jgi:RNA polymerase sigma factor (sigma-70 family)